VTITLQSGSRNMAFHENVAGVAFAKLPDALLRKLGADVYTAQDDKSNIAVRARLYADHKISAVRVALDVLFGYTLLDRQLGCNAIPV
jgi:hypothetical protein